MRAYSALSQEAVRARDSLQDWAGEGFISEAQYLQMSQETVCDLRRTNIFLRLVLFFFTLLIVNAAVALCFVIFLSNSPAPTPGVFLLFAGAGAYAAAELAVSQGHLYRYGIEEAFAVCSVGLVCAGIQTALFSGKPYSPTPGGAEFLVPLAGVILSLWIWHRFGFPYAPVSAMIFVLSLPAHWTSSHGAQHLIVAAFYALGLLILVAIRRSYRFTYLNVTYSLAEGFLWLGIYLAINLQLSSLNLLAQWWGHPGTGTEFSRPFYWATWLVTWCVPPIVLARGVRQKDRLVMAAGAICGVLTLVTNKPYLGWARHAWDPMLLGALLIAVALLLRRWLAHGPGEIRQGFTARRLSGKDKHWLSAGSTVFGLTSANTITPPQQTGGSGFHFGGGDFGGGGASSDF
jgi:hypothetical protein